VRHYAEWVPATSPFYGADQHTAREIVSVEGAVFVLWGKPALGDVERVVQSVESAARSSESPIVLVARVPEAAPAPDDAVRARLKAAMPGIVELCSSYHAVLEGAGFVAAAKRAIMLSLLQLGFRKGTFFVHDHVSGVLSNIDRTARPRAVALMALAAERGLLTAPPPE